MRAKGDWQGDNPVHIDDEFAFVLHARLWRETSLLLELLTKSHGRIGLVARGVQSGKNQSKRAALQPLQWICFSAVMRGEMANLRQVEALDAAPRLDGMALFAGFYLNELTLSLTVRDVAIDDCYTAYGRARLRLADRATSLAWTLRCFERDLLDALGVGFDWRSDTDGHSIQASGAYWLNPVAGPQRCYASPPSGLLHRDQPLVSGAALLALMDDQQPTSVTLVTSLRAPMRAVIQHHLGGKKLKSWEMITAFPRSSSR